MRRAPLVAATLSAALLLTSPAAVRAASSVHSEGDPVRVAGRVTDVEGRPLEGVTVLLEASRDSLRLRNLPNLFRRDATMRERDEPLQIPLTTGPEGRFSHEWSWDPHYNYFELVVAMPVERAGRDDFEPFERRDVTELMQQQSAVDVDLQVQDSGYFYWLRRYLRGEASADEQKLYREMGRPDRVDHHQRHTGAEDSWWYFERGKMYLLRNGAIAEVVDFAPIPPRP